MLLVIVLVAFSFATNIMAVEFIVEVKKSVNVLVLFYSWACLHAVCSAASYTNFFFYAFLCKSTCRDSEQMTSKDFMEYPNANIDIASLEEVMLYAHGGGRKPVSSTHCMY